MAGLRRELNRPVRHLRPALRPAQQVQMAADRPDRPGQRARSAGPGSPAPGRVPRRPVRARRSTPWRSSTRPASAGEGIDLHRPGRRPAQPRLGADTPPTRWRSAWTSTASPAWTTSPGCSATPRTRPAPTWAPWSSRSPRTPPRTRQAFSSTPPPTSPPSPASTHRRRSSPGHPPAVPALPGPPPGTLVPAAEYLSGNVRAKLPAAEAAAAATTPASRSTSRRCAMSCRAT